MRKIKRYICIMSMICGGSLLLTACGSENVKTETIAVQETTAANIEKIEWKEFVSDQAGIALSMPADMIEVNTSDRNTLYLGGNDNISLEIARMDEQCDDMEELQELAEKTVYKEASIIKKRGIDAVEVKNEENTIHYFFFGPDKRVYYVWASSNETMNERTDVEQAIVDVGKISDTLHSIAQEEPESETYVTEEVIVGAAPATETENTAEVEINVNENVMQSANSEHIQEDNTTRIEKVVMSDMPVDYGTSELYTREEIDEAVAVIKKEFGKWNGCVLHSIHYAGDDANTSFNLEWLNDLKDDKQYVKCMEILTDFHSPVNGGGSWEADSEYMNYQWWLAKEENGPWELVSWGY